MYFLFFRRIYVKEFFICVCAICYFESHCTKAAACIGISNSTEDTVRLSYKTVDMDLPITKKPSPVGVFNILPSHGFILSEYPNYGLDDM